MDARHVEYQPWTEGAVEVRPGQLATKLVIGDADDAHGTVAFITRWSPGRRVEIHTHRVNYCEVILEGSQRVGATTFRSGDVRMARAGQLYGPLVAGDEGCTFIAIFDRQDFELVFRETTESGDD